MYISKWTLNKMRQRNENVRNMTKEQLEMANKDIKRKLRADKRSWQNNLVKGSLSIKDKWAGIKFLKADFKPRVYARKNRHGDFVPLKDITEATA